MDKKILNIALVAHDARKKELVEWCKFNADFLSQHNLCGTGTTARLISEIEYNGEYPLKNITRLLPGPLSGDAKISSMIADGDIDVLIFFCDNLVTQGHQQDIGALSRIASLYNIAFATNRTTADMIISNPLLLDPSYERIIPSAIQNYINRQL